MKKSMQLLLAISLGFPVASSWAQQKLIDPINRCETRNCGAQRIVSTYSYSPSAGTTPRVFLVWKKETDTCVRIEVPDPHDRYSVTGVCPDAAYHDVQGMWPWYERSDGAPHVLIFDETPNRPGRGYCSITIMSQYNGPRLASNEVPFVMFYGRYADAPGKSENDNCSYGTFRD